MPTEHLLDPMARAVSRVIETAHRSVDGERGWATARVDLIEALNEACNVAVAEHYPDGYPGKEDE